MAHEIEAKFALEGFRALRKALRDRGAEYVRTVLQTDLYFDQDDGKFRHTDCALRLRKSLMLKSSGETEDLRPLITYKGPKDKREPGTLSKRRLEVQTHCDDAVAIEEVLRWCGLHPRRIIQKRRATYRLGSCTVELDELPRIGCFVEVEGPSEKVIDRVCAELGIEAEPIHRSYLSLAEEALGLRGAEHAEITFEKYQAEAHDLF